MNLNCFVFLINQSINQVYNYNFKKYYSIEEA